jgi:hypothetical protein
MTGKGRSTAYTPELGEKIAAILAQNKTYKDVTAELGIPRSTISEWRYKHADFSELCARVAEVHAESCVNTCSEIIDDMLGGVITPEQARVAVAHHQWVAGRKNPKNWGSNPVVVTPPEQQINILELARGVVYLLQAGAEQGEESPIQIEHKPD